MSRVYAAVANTEEKVVVGFRQRDGEQSFTVMGADSWSYALCDWLLGQDGGPEHVSHYPRVGFDGELMIKTVHSAADARSWLKATIGEVSPWQLSKLNRRVAEVDPANAKEFAREFASTSRRGPAPTVSSWTGPGWSPLASCTAHQ